MISGYNCNIKACISGHFNSIFVVEISVMTTSINRFNNYIPPNYCLGIPDISKPKTHKQIVIIYASDDVVEESKVFIDFLLRETKRLSEGKKILPLAQSIFKSLSSIGDYMKHSLGKKVVIDESANILSKNNDKSRELLSFFIDYLSTVIKTHDRVKKTRKEGKLYTVEELRNRLKIG